jgi:hypothetical protein
MSYINDALRKVQKEKELRYVAYEHMVSASGRKPDWSRKWLSITGILIVFFWGYKNSGKDNKHISFDGKIPGTENKRTSCGAGYG